MLNFENVPKTGGFGYEFLSEDEFRSAYELAKNNTLEQLEINHSYQIYRAAKTDDNKLLFMRINATIMEMNEERMFFLHKHVEGNHFKGKIFNYNSGFNENWFFIENTL